MRSNKVGEERGVERERQKPCLHSSRPTRPKGSAGRGQFAALAALSPRFAILSELFVRPGRPMSVRRVRRAPAPATCYADPLTILRTRSGLIFPSE